MFHIPDPAQTHPAVLAARAALARPAVPPYGWGQVPGWVPQRPSVAPVAAQGQPDAAAAAGGGPQFWPQGLVANAAKTDLNSHALGAIQAALAAFKARFPNAVLRPAADTGGSEGE